MGASRLIMTSNILRAAGLVIAIVAVSMGGGLIHVAAALVIGEVVATVAIFMQLHFEHEISIRRAAPFFCILSAATAAGVSIAWLWTGVPFVMSLAVHGAILIISLIALYAVSPDARYLITHCRSIVGLQGARGIS